MNAFEINKILGAVLGALVFVMGLSVLSEIIFSEEPPKEPGYAVVIEPDEPTDGEEAVEEEPFEVLLASADPDAGERASRVCSACHVFEEGGANGVGPQLWNIVGREIASVEGFSYSSALQSHAEENPEWTYAELNGFLENPQGWVPGTSMGYAGISDRQERADVIAYMKSVSPDAPPLPEPPAEAAPAEEEGGEQEMAAADAAAPAEDGGEEGSGEAAAADDAPAGDSFTQLVASSDPAAGEANASVCMACHNAEEGAAHKLGPNLYGVFGGEIAAAEGFQYSDAMQAHAEEEGRWTLANLNAYLEAPMEVVQGTSMAYAGVKEEEARAEIIAWLHSVSPDAGPIEAAAADEGGETEAEETQTAAADPAATASDEGAAEDIAAAPEDSNTETAANEEAGDSDEGEGSGGVRIEPARRGSVEIVNPGGNE